MTPPTEAVEAVSHAIAQTLEKTGDWKKTAEAAIAAYTAAAEVGLAPGCCSAASPCDHQKRDPTTICESCTAAAEVGPLTTEQLDVAQFGKVLHKRVGPKLKGDEAYYDGYCHGHEEGVAATIERCVARLIEIGARYHQGHDLMLQLRALKDKP